MVCKVLVLTHGTLAQSFVETAKLIIGNVDYFQFKNLPTSFDIEQYKKEIEEIIEDNSEQGILIITDLLGGSPFISCSQIVHNHWEKMELITGCNLQMLLAVSEEIEEKSIAELKHVALQVGRDGIIDLKEIIKESK